VAQTTVFANCSMIAPNNTSFVARMERHADYRVVAACPMAHASGRTAIN
jgi:hypothetical protein